jgi:hypothetical protein
MCVFLLDALSVSLRLLTHGVISQLLAGERDKLKTMQERNDDLEREVERFHQRREIEQRVSFLGSSSFLFSAVLFTIHFIIFWYWQIEDIELLIPIQEMKESKVLYYETKGKQRGLHEVVTALKDKNAPAHALLEYASTPMRWMRSVLTQFLIQNLRQEACTAD